MCSDALCVVRGERSRGLDAGVERDYPLEIVFLDGTLERNLVRHPLRAHRIALDHHLGLIEERVVDHLAIDDRDDDLVRNDDLLRRRLCKAEAMCHSTIDCFVIHRSDREIALLVAFPDVVVAWGGCEKQALPDRQVLVR